MTNLTSRPSRLNWRLGLGREIALAFWGVFFLEAAFGSYMGIWPLWIEHLGAPVALVGFVLGSSGIVRLVVLLPSAALAERFGARKLVVAARFAALLGMVGAAVATHWTHLAVMVIGAAIGELAFPIIQSHVTAHAGATRIRAFTLVFTVGPSLALIATPLLAGLLIELFDLRAAFLLAALCTLGSIAFFWRLSAEEPTRTADRSPTSGSVATYRAALGDRSVRRLLLLQGATIFSLALGTSLIPTFLEDERGLSPATIASLGALAAVGSALFGLAVTRIDRLQRAPFVGAAIAVGVTALGFALYLGSGLLPFIGFAFVCRGGLFSAWALFAAAVGESATAANRARSFALVEIVGGLCFSLAPMAAGQLYAINSRGPLALATALAIILIPSLVLAQRFAIRDVRPAEDLPAVGSPEPRSGSLDAPAN